MYAIHVANLGVVTRRKSARQAELSANSYADLTRGRPGKASLPITVINMNTGEVVATITEDTQ